MMDNATRRKVAADLDAAAEVLAGKLRQAADDVGAGTSGQSLRNLAIATAATVEALPHSLYPSDTIDLPPRAYDELVVAAWAAVDATGNNEAALALSAALRGAAQHDPREPEEQPEGRV